MINKKELPKKLKSLMTMLFIDGSRFSYDDYLSAIIIAVLELHDGNRVHAARTLKIPIRTFRIRLRLIESLGYEVPPAKTGCRKKEV